MKEFGFHRTMLWSVVGFAAIVTSGCASTPENPFEGPPPMVSLFLDVTNHHPTEVSVEATGRSRTILLGTVPARSSAGFPFSWPENDFPQFRLRLLVGGQCLTRPLEPAASGLILIEVDADFEHTDVCIG